MLDYATRFSANQNKNMYAIRAVLHKYCLTICFPAGALLKNIPALTRDMFATYQPWTLSGANKLSIQVSSNKVPP